MFGMIVGVYNIHRSPSLEIIVCFIFGFQLRGGGQYRQPSPMYWCYVTNLLNKVAHVLAKTLETKPIRRYYICINVTSLQMPLESLLYRGHCIHLLSYTVSAWGIRVINRSPVIHTVNYLGWHNWWHIGLYIASRITESVYTL